MILLCIRSVTVLQSSLESVAEKMRLLMKDIYKDIRPDDELP